MGGFELNIIEGIYQRKSIRKYKNEVVKREDIVKCLEAAVEAPSPKHQQNWYFVVVEKKELIETMAQLVEESHKRIGEYAENEKEKQKFMRFMSYYTLFKDAPVVVLVYAKPYVMIEEKLLRAGGAGEEVIDALKVPQSAAQGIGAAVENFLLAATELGYGTCYMTGPTHAKSEIETLIGVVKPEYELMSLIAMGVPADETTEKPKRLPLDQVVTFIE